MKNFFRNNWPLILTVLYVISPIDLIPDVVFGLGSIDDATLVAIQGILALKKRNQK